MNWRKREVGAQFLTVTTERQGTDFLFFLWVGVVPTLSFHRVVVESSVFDGRVGPIIISVHTGQKVAHRWGNRSGQMVPIFAVILAVAIAVAVSTKVATVMSVLVLPMVAGDVVRIEGRLEVLRKVGMGGRHQRGLDQCHVLVQQAMIIIVHAHRSHCNDVKVG